MSESERPESVWSGSVTSDFSLTIGFSFDPHCCFLDTQYLHSSQFSDSQIFTIDKSGWANKGIIPVVSETISVAPPSVKFVVPCTIVSALVLVYRSVIVSYCHYLYACNTCVSWSLCFVDELSEQA